MESTSATSLNPCNLEFHFGNIFWTYKGTWITYTAKSKAILAAE